MRVRNKLLGDLKQRKLKSFWQLVRQLWREIPVLFLDRIALLLPDALFIKLKFKAIMGYWPNLKHPKTFSEKLQWLKLHDRRPEYTIMVDKAEAKKWVAERIGEEYIIPTIGVWNSVDEIDWDKLPDQFVIKCTHDSGGIVICKDKKSFNIDNSKQRLKHFLHRRYFYQNREWPYKNVKPRIIAEKFLDPRPESIDLPDYKFFCFDGEPKYCQVISGRNETMCIDFFDHEWKHQPFHEPQNYPFALVEPRKPANFNRMWDAAKKLAQGRPFLRVDFYEVNNKVYFGEITFYPTSGMGGFDPKKWDNEFGGYILLSNELK